MSSEDSAGLSLPPGVLQRIMDSRRQTDGSRWTPMSVKRALAERGVTASRQYLSRLAHQGGAPGWDLVVALAELFEVSTDEFRASESQEHELSALMYRAGELSSDKQDELRRYVEYLEFQQQQGQD